VAADLRTQSVRWQSSELPSSSSNQPRPPRSAPTPAVLLPDPDYLVLYTETGLTSDRLHPHTQQPTVQRSQPPLLPSPRVHDQHQPPRPALHFQALLATAIHQAPPRNPVSIFWEHAHRWIARTPWPSSPSVNTTWIRSSIPGVDLPQEVIPDARDRQDVSRLDAHRARGGETWSGRPRCDQVFAPRGAIHVPGTKMARYF
jgi:hypothetical protein